MNSDYIIIERELLKAVLDENKRLKEELEKYKTPKKEEPMDRQITMQEYISDLAHKKSLSLKNEDRK